MSGIYIHIPFCKSRCIYCGFYSSTLSALAGRYAGCVCRELAVRKDYLADAVQTVYLGGGTPSQLSAAQLDKIFTAIDDGYGLPRDGEITMECNPDDITPEYAALLGRLPVNRVSMGVQTFSDERLRFLNRRHTANGAREAFRRLRAAGIGNVSLDLMFGFPGETVDEWVSDIEAALELEPEHLSAYSLMYDDGTVLSRMLEKGEIRAVDDDTSNRMYDVLMDKLSAAGYEHYEISNFAKPGFRARHNSSYWHAVPYLGIGAAAHSYNGTSRQWNVADVRRYIDGIENGRPETDGEKLDTRTRYNDMVTTSLRTKNGIELEQVRNVFGEKYYDYLLSSAHISISAGHLTVHDGRMALTRSGLYVSDDVMSDLIMLE